MQLRRPPTIAAASVILLVLAGWMVMSHSTARRLSHDGQALSQAAFEDATGIKVLYISVTAGGGMIDIRYQVLNPDKALIVHDEEDPPTIVDEVSGRSLSRPWMDHAHDLELHTAVTYHQLVMNAGGVIKRGSTVTLVIGDADLENIEVQ